MSTRSAYSGFDISSASEQVYALVDQLKESYKHSPNFSTDKYEEITSSFAPSHLFFTDKDLYYSNPTMVEGDYLHEFIEGDERTPYRGNFKRTEAGIVFPELVTKGSKPGDELVITKAAGPGMYQDECAPIPDGHFRSIVDQHKFDWAEQFLDADDYFRIMEAFIASMKKGSDQMDKLAIDTFLCAMLQIGSYPQGHILYPFFTGNDDYVPDNDYSKNAREFFLKSGEIRKALQTLAKYVSTIVTARVSYLTNINVHEVIGQGKDRTIPKGNKKEADLSSAEKKLSAVRGWFLDKDGQQKYTLSTTELRRSSLESLVSCISRVLDRMMTHDRRNGCGHKFGEENKNKEGIELQCRPENLLVFMNKQDLRDCYYVRGSSAAGPFTEGMPFTSLLKEYKDMGITFYGLDFILPSMAVVMDRIGFRLKEYFKADYTQEHPYHLVTSGIQHSRKKPVLYKKFACNVIQLAKDQKYALPIAGGSENLPFFAEE